MPLCRELHLATVEIKTGGLVEDTYQRLIVDDQTTEELGKRSEPYGVSRWDVLDPISSACRQQGWWPWAILFLDTEYDIADDLRAARKDRQSIAISAYSLARGGIINPDAPPASILWIRGKENLEEASEKEEVFAKSWKLLEDKPANQRWIVLLDALSEQRPRYDHNRSP